MVDQLVLVCIFSRRICDEFVRPVIDAGDVHRDARAGVPGCFPLRFFLFPPSAMLVLAEVQGRH